ncbi:hypothetical protein Nepgr_027117 [Nepenthes gracilis]|uniref:Homeobox domain-containing protein n=1 Tax=Nepenthes gracilis TaxID=150966 RepID=A0AAD3Y2T0_NEPGR|nr:hypothetical protein Nepgr_027117 [Nepenthes gracilis]
MQASDDHELSLGLGFPSTVENSCKVTSTQKAKWSPARYEPSLTLSLSGETYHQPPRKVDCYVINKRNTEEPGGSGSGSGEMCSQASPVSSFSNAASTAVKRERGGGMSEEADVERVSSRASDELDEDQDGSNTRKKLRLTKEQSALLEESFKQHTTLDPKQKQALAHRLSLRQRQVEVWFQNRRARTKLKQTEVDCEFLKKCCETLTDENRRLQKELEELRALKLAQPLHLRLPAVAPPTMCLSCERTGASRAGSSSASKTPFAVASKSHHFCNSFTKPSAAC